MFSPHCFELRAIVPLMFQSADSRSRGGRLYRSQDAMSRPCPQGASGQQSVSGRHRCIPEESALPCPRYIQSEGWLTSVGHVPLPCDGHPFCPDGPYQCLPNLLPIAHLFSSGGSMLRAWPLCRFCSSTPSAWHFHFMSMPLYLPFPGTLCQFPMESASSKTQNNAKQGAGESADRVSSR
jgi:hypothetical protein